MFCPDWVFAGSERVIPVSSFLQEIISINKKKTLTCFFKTKFYYGKIYIKMRCIIIGGRGEKGIKIKLINLGLLEEDEAY